MNSILVVVLAALGLGVAIGKWWEHDRAGGTADLSDYVDVLEDEVEAERDWNASLRDQRNGCLASLTGRVL